jgi:hypothetical protein
MLTRVAGTGVVSECEDASKQSTGRRSKSREEEEETRKD